MLLQILIPTYFYCKLGILGADIKASRRYLRARKFNPNEALIQFKDTEDWRKDNHLVELYNTIDVKEYDDTRKLVHISRFSFSSVALE